ncbi:NAD(P)H oxidoreductase [Brevibacillus sp. Leaf182]|uniref:NAD(P)H oxidoreductase n=1 Tax=Brevibacillus sp. Leaf182 TaxID=1736290 RepID=UPI0006FF4660|nr:NAD(P)H oxidoreductase [Brevibacillus sp. Leaf182]RAT94579.1 NAD(P)H oxidoreductase [Brevibacillus sp. Leaf182]
MKVLTVVTHPRTNSLTFAVAERFVQGLKDAGHEVEVLDLHRSGFHPVLWEEDEPDWNNGDKKYSEEVEIEMERMKKHDALAFIFPIWWFSMPAMLKGYIDRVWNNGFAYGSRKLHHKHALWIGLAAAPEDHFQKRSYDQMMAHHLNVGISSYVGIDDSRVAFLYDTLAQNPAHIEQLLDRAYQLGFHYGKKESPLFL